LAHILLFTLLGLGLFGWVNWHCWHY